MSVEFNLECALPKAHHQIITLAHGSGGRLTQQLLNDIFRPAFANPYLNQEHDSTRLQLETTNIAVTTDSYVVEPMFFPGGDIGKLAIIGTINDLAMRGAQPLYLTCGFILTEGLRVDTLIQIVNNMAQAAIENNIQIVAGDIKVVEKSKSPSVYINTTGLGSLSPKINIAPTEIKENDSIIISHDIGRHGLAVLSAREQLQLEPEITTDCRTLAPLVDALIKEGIHIHCLRDLTRGGLAGALIELAQSSNFSMSIYQSQIPISQSVAAGCELLGLDPLFVANEGCMIIFVDETEEKHALEVLSQHSKEVLPRKIGITQKSQSSKPDVILTTEYGTKRKLNLFSGEQLPRIC